LLNLCAKLICETRKYFNYLRVLGKFPISYMQNWFIYRIYRYICMYIAST